MSYSVIVRVINLLIADPSFVGNPILPTTTSGFKKLAPHLMLTPTMFAVFLSTVSTTSTSPRPIRLRDNRKLT